MGPLGMETLQSRLLGILIPQQQPAGSSSPWKAPVGKDTLSVPLLGGGPHCSFSCVIFSAFLFSAVEFMGLRSFYWELREL